MPIRRCRPRRCAAWATCRWKAARLERQEAEVSRVDPGGAEAIRLYTQLLQEHPDYARNDRVLYQLARAYETTGQPEKALATLDDFVRRYPAVAPTSSRCSSGAANCCSRRIATAKPKRPMRVVTGAGAGEFYEQALYKQGWSLFKQNLNDDSLPLFARLLDVTAARSGVRRAAAGRWNPWDAPTASWSKTRCA